MTNKTADRISRALSEFGRSVEHWRGRNEERWRAAWLEFADRMELDEPPEVDLEYAEAHAGKDEGAWQDFLATHRLIALDDWFRALPSTGVPDLHEAKETHRWPADFPYPPREPPRAWSDLRRIARSGAPPAKAYAIIALFELAYARTVRDTTR